MKKLLLPIVTVLLFTACKKQQKVCLSYEEAIIQGVVEHKTSNLIISDSLYYTLDHVIDKTDEKYGKYCVGIINVDNDEVLKILNVLTTEYDNKQVNQVTLFTEGADMCNNNRVTRDNIQTYMVYYLDRENYLCMDYIDGRGNTETHRVSEVYGSIAVYYLFTKSRPKEYAGGISIKNKDFDFKKIKLIPKEQDSVYYRVHNRKMN